MVRGPGTEWYRCALTDQFRIFRRAGPLAEAGSIPNFVQYLGDIHEFQHLRQGK